MPPLVYYKGCERTARQVQLWPQETSDVSLWQCANSETPQTQITYTGAQL